MEVEGLGELAVAVAVMGPALVPLAVAVAFVTVDVRVVLHMALRGMTILDVCMVVAAAAAGGG